MIFVDFEGNNCERSEQLAQEILYPLLTHKHKNGYGSQNQSVVFYFYFIFLFFFVCPKFLWDDITQERMNIFDELFFVRQVCTWCFHLMWYTFCPITP
jgi:hypothetical protein